MASCYKNRIFHDVFHGIEAAVTSAISAIFEHAQLARDQTELQDLSFELAFGHDFKLLLICCKDSLI